MVSFRSLAVRARTRWRSLGLALFLVIAAAFVLLAVLIYMHLGPMAIELALSDATDQITVAVNEVVAEKIRSGDADYSSLVRLEKDETGSITALVTDMANINYLQSEVTAAVVRRFSEGDITRVRIPVGTLMGGAFFAGRGPCITVDILSVTNVSTAFRNEFSSAGINQTRHRIIMDITVTVGILLAGYEDRWENITTEVPVAETVIVGSVPNTYAGIYR